MEDNDSLLAVDLILDGGDAVVVVTGELDPHTVPKFEDTLRQASADAPSRVVLDLAGVSFMDSSGLRVLLAAHEDLATRGIQLVLRRPSDPIRRLLEITDLLDRLDVE